MARRNLLSKGQSAWKSSDEIRRINALALRHENGDEAFIKAMGWKEASARSMMTQLFGSRKGSAPARGFSHDNARKIERAYGLPTNWLDSLHGDDSIQPLALRETGGSYRLNTVLKQLNDVDVIISTARSRTQQEHDKARQMIDLLRAQLRRLATEID